MCAQALIEVPIGPGPFSKIPKSKARYGRGLNGAGLRKNGALRTTNILNL